MTKQDLIDALKDLNPEQELRWMIDLGANLTVSARAYYPLEQRAGSPAHLVGFKELQHQIYGRVRHLPGGKEWTLCSFLDGLIHKAEFYGISGDLGCALRSSLSGMC